MPSKPLLLILFSLLGLVTSTNVHSMNGYTSDQIKAVYLFRIASFIYWNDEPEMTVLKFCVPDNTRMRNTLEKLIVNKKIRALPLAIESRDSNECDILYVSNRSELGRLTQVSEHAVTISDIPQFSTFGGVIELALVGGKIKPKVNVDNIGDYQISSKLLRVAIIEGGAL